ncbi:antA/AntB antirepressor family protein [Parabacteroides pacaensis]|uniref:antA/AntB antirepressor family protein n=1 Tax=Parabacteroides pacaensis TaxID=2086575 RepID=UPI001F4085BF|nr:antA/AntB antirepressor family protein [Parabacteroides pacaensis]
MYGRKADAVEALRRDFIENDDYKTLRQNPQGGKFASIDYYLTVSCLEYFIVKKVRPVFEVYRQVFHHTANDQKIVSSSLLGEVKTKIATADWLAKFLRLNDSSKLALAKTIAEPLGLPTPDYIESKNQLLSATELLKRAGVGMNARDFNIKMKEKGFITELERPSHKGMKKFKSLTGAGLNYGENQVNPGNPKETQPLYYADKFENLLSTLG